MRKRRYKARLPTPVASASPTATPEPTPQATPTPAPDEPPFVALGAVGKQGGKRQSSDGRVSVEFPAGAVPQENVAIKHRAQGAAQADPRRPNVDQRLVRFDLEAEGVPHFGKPVTLTVNLQGLVDLSSLPEDVMPYLAYRSPDNPDEWISVPIHADLDHNRPSGATIP